MTRDLKALTLLSALILIGTGGALVAFARWGQAAPNAGSRNAGTTHTLFHIGCTHHNHGPAWHAGHAGSASFQRPVGGPLAEPVVPLLQRSLTAGR